MTKHVKEHAETEEVKEQEKDTVTITKEEYELLLKAKEAQEKLLYVQAEFNNLKKKTSRDLKQKMAYANKSLKKEVLPIIDNL